MEDKVASRSVGELEVEEEPFKTKKHTEFSEQRCVSVYNIIVLPYLK